MTAGGRTWRRDVRSGYSYLAANDPRVHVGLGTAAAIESVDVTWAGGQRERFGPFGVDAVTTLRQGTGVPRPAAATAPR